MAVVNPNAPGFFKGKSGSGISNTDLYVVSGTVTGENLILTLSNSTTVTISLSSVFDYNEISGLSYTESNNTLTLNQQGRTFSAVIPRGDDTPDTNTFLESASFSANTNDLTLTLNTGTNVVVSLQDLVDEVVVDTNTFVTGLEVTDGGQELTVTRNDGHTFEVDTQLYNNANTDINDVFGIADPVAADSDKALVYTGATWSYSAVQSPITVNTVGSGNVSKVSYDAATDTFTITDTDFSVDSETSWTDERSGSSFSSQMFELDSDTGFELYERADGTVAMRTYVPTPAFAITATNLPPSHFSWFNDADDRTSTVSATEGTLTNIATATFTGSTPTITQPDVVDYTVPNTAGSYTLSITANGSNEDSVAQTANISRTVQVVKDYFFATNQSSSSAAFSPTAGRNQRDFENGTFTAIGHTFMTVSADLGTLTFSTPLGALSTITSTVTVNINGVTKSYTRYYLGNFDANTSVTTSGG